MATVVEHRWIDVTTVVRDHQAGADEFGSRREFLQIVEQAKAIAGSTNGNGERRP